MRKKVTRHCEALAEAIQKFGSYCKRLDCFTLRARNDVRGFTLAEVLITLGIIGVVAALTMPALITKHKEKETVVKVKKFYSVLSNAYMLAINEHGTPENWDLIGYDSKKGAANLLDKIAPYMRFQEICRVDENCSYAMSDLNGTHYSAYNSGKNNIAAILADGTRMTVCIRDANCALKRGTSAGMSTICGFAMFDVNGSKPPNTLGKDMFGAFYFTRDGGIIPEGILDNTYRPFKQDCLVNKVGYGCTAWVIVNENLDYLHCDELNWNTKTRCK
ncbi:MAG: type II secretion system GspH family protein [Heliobacteriaceae bacterium]|jgi:prepilin-type N-terminal cleavage/methylation domain-containing protein|nr:type II secretion system GspH family protein [Heliobacteriaceae bacterium]